MFNLKQRLFIIILVLALGISVLPINGCTVPSSSENFSIPQISGGEGMLSEPISESEHEPASEPVSEPVAENMQDKSDSEPLSTLVPDPPKTPIHPYWSLNGTPPTAPGLVMRHRVFDVEPRKIVYLTIDDGPYPETTPKILNILQAENIKATFFVIGRQIERYPQLLKDQYSQGHAIGNHTYSHDYSIIYRSPADFLADVKKNEELIFKIIGIKTHLLRAPGGTQGHFNVEYHNAVDAADYLVYDWNSTFGDTASRLVAADQLVRNIKEQVPGKNRVILLMHDIGTKTTSVEALPTIIQYLKKEGYIFGVLTPEVMPVVFPGGFKSN